jgi:hypothetical protein
MDLSEYKALTLANTAAYESCRDFLSKEHYGEYVLIHGGRVRGIFPSREQARDTCPDVYPRAIIKIVPDGESNVDWEPSFEPYTLAA